MNDPRDEDRIDTGPVMIGKDWYQGMTNGSGGPQSEREHAPEAIYQQAELIEPWPDSGARVARYGDQAMFRAEPLRGSDGPEVFILSMNPDPLGSIAAAVQMYRGNVIRDLGELTDDQRREALAQIQQTKLKAPFEFVKMHMLLENIHRGVTHQLVRQRTAVYAQESMRFAVKEGMAAATHLPPSLMMFRDPERVRELDERMADATDNGFLAKLSEPEQQFVIWRQTAREIESGYNQLINRGMPAEEARGLAPTNIGTRVHYATDLRNLLETAGNRLCTQAQFEWRMIWIRILEAMREFGGKQIYRTTIPQVDGGGLPSKDQTQIITRRSDWQFDALTDMFRPACYLTGKCEFAAMDLDRHCQIRNRVDANHEIGRPSSEWHEELDVVEGSPIAIGVGPTSVVRDEKNVPVFIGAIRPAEWLLDPTAARRAPGGA